MRKEFEDRNLIICEISRTKIETFDFEDILSVLNDFKADPKSFMNKFSFMISGYDDDLREIYQIDEVRQYLSFLDKTFPYWLFFMNLDLPPSQSPLQLLITCLVELEVVEDLGTSKSLMLNMSQLHEFVKSHLPYFNEMMDKAKISKIDEQKRFYLLMDHIYGRLR